MGEKKKKGERGSAPGSSAKKLTCKRRLRPHFCGRSPPRSPARLPPCLPRHGAAGETGREGPTSLTAAGAPSPRAAFPGPPPLSPPHVAGSAPRCQRDEERRGPPPSGRARGRRHQRLPLPAARNQQPSARTRPLPAALPPPRPGRVRAGRCPPPHHPSPPPSLPRPLRRLSPLPPAAAPGPGYGAEVAGPLALVRLLRRGLLPGEPHLQQLLGPFEEVCTVLLHGETTRQPTTTEINGDPTAAPRLPLRLGRASPSGAVVAFFLFSILI